MKKPVLFMALIIIISIWANAAKNSVEVHFRVFSGANFVEGLSIDDIQLFEDGKPQTIDALYLVKNKEILSMQGLEKKPKVKRLFVFVFYLRQYPPRLDEVIDYLFNQIIVSGDALTFLTPEKTYNLRGPALHLKPKEEIAHQMKGLLRRDITMGNSSYLKRLNQLKEILADLSDESGSNIIQDMGIGLMKYKDTLGSIEKMRVKEQSRIINFLGQQKSKKEKKFAFIFYEREVKPDFNASVMQRFQQQFNDRIDVLNDLQGLFDIYRRKVVFDLKKIENRFPGLNLVVNFVNYKGMGFAPARGVVMREYSEDALELFTKLVQLSGGMNQNSANLVAFFNTAQSYSSQFYTLQYVSSSPGKKKNKLTKIEIKIKDKNYKVYHRQGY
ncbi:MAG: hypothetical protein JSV88_14530 [Candidatus Aminicenantes bacterium]|nr:MAG: hypothetical protein JSV88_14530 [Candidatus Aminicenantes bacterium]